MRNFTIRNHILRGAALGVMVLAPLSVYSLNLDVSDDEKNPIKIEAIDFQEALKGSLMGAVLSRSDGTSCGLIVDAKDQIKDLNAHPLGDEPTRSKPSFLAFKEDLRKALAQHNIPLCSSEDLEVIEQMDEAFKTDEIFEGSPVQMACLGRVLFSSSIRAAITSIAGTGALSSSSSLVLGALYYPQDALGTLLVAVGVSVYGGIVPSAAGGAITGVRLGQVMKGNPFQKTVIGETGGLITGLAVSWTVDQTCFWGIPVILGSITYSPYSP